MKKNYRIRKGSIADKVLTFDWYLSNSWLGVVVMGIIGLGFGAIFALGLNSIHPIF